MTKLSLLLILLAGCVTDETHDPNIPPPPTGSGSGAGSGTGPGGPGSGAGAVGGDPSLNQFVLASKDDQIVRVAPDLSAHAVVIAFGSYIDVESLAIVGGTIYAGAEDNSVNAIDLATGALEWESPLGRFENSTLAEPEVVIRDSYAYAAGLNGLFASIELATGAHQWGYAMSPTGQTDSYYSQIGKPLVTADRIYIGTHDSLETNYLHAIDRATGARIWRLELADAMSGTPQLAGNTLLVPAGDLHAMDPATGAIRWTFPQYELTRGASTPVVAGDVVLVQGATDVADGRLYCLELATGALRWSIDAGNDYAGVYTPLVMNGVVFGVYERGSSQWPFGNGLPFLADLATGAVIWRNADVSVETSPVWANGRLYFHGQNFKGTGGIDNNVGLLALDATTGAFVALDNYFRYSRSVRPIVVATNGVF